MSRWKNGLTAVSSDGQRAKILLSYRGRPSFTLVSFFGRWGLKNQYHLTPTILSLQKTHQGVEYFELNRSWPNLTPRYFLSLSILWNWPEISSTLIQLKMPRHPQQGNTDRVLVENKFHTSVTWRSKFSAVFLQLQCVSAELSVYIELFFLMTQTWTLFKL